MINLSCIQDKIDNKTKPLGSLGYLESIAHKICKIQNSLNPNVDKACVLVFGGDHGISNEGTSCYPQAVTKQMFYNFISGGAAINVFCNQNELDLKLIDSGVNTLDDPSFDSIESIISMKIAHGTNNCLKDKAMTSEQLDQCFEVGSHLIQNHLEPDVKLVGFGEMGIGNTASSSLIMSSLLNIPINECTGRGTGLNDHQLENKIKILQKASDKHSNVKTPLDVLQTFGGFEMAQIVSSILTAHEKSLVILIDGFISSVCLLVASKINPDVLNNVVFSHCSNEMAHRKLLDYFNTRAVLDLDLRLGEGTGCALAYPIVKAACRFVTDMASFESANVSKKQK
jgi:nicotinate-nucleotide--dimethylbenzimidazole phosphoribosyltransferase